MSERKERDQHLALASEMGERMAMEAYADLRTLFMQDIEAWKVAKAHGLDVKDSFRVIRLGERDGMPHYHVFTAGDEGVKYAKECLLEMSSERFLVDNKKVKRLTVEDVRERIRREFENRMRQLEGGDK